jgi:hypothetical protein
MLLPGFGAGMFAEQLAEGAWACWRCSSSAAIFASSCC